MSRNNVRLARETDAGVRANGSSRLPEMQEPIKGISTGVYDPYGTKD
jgi:hypothetical protein